MIRLYIIFYLFVVWNVVIMELTLKKEARILELFQDLRSDHETVPMLFIGLFVFFNSVSELFLFLEIAPQFLRDLLIDWKGVSHYVVSLWFSNVN